MPKSSCSNKNTMESIYTARAHHVVSTPSGELSLDKNIKDSFIHVLLGGDNIEGFIEIAKGATNHGDNVIQYLTYKDDTVGLDNQNLEQMAVALKNLAEIIYLAPDKTWLELSAFPTSDPICLATCICKHYQLWLRNLHKVNPEVEEPQDNHDVELMVKLLKTCEEEHIPVYVTKWQYSNETAYPVRIQIRIGDLRRVVGIEG